MSTQPSTQNERFGDYVLERRLGAGGMAEVFRARLERPGQFSKKLALKRSLPMLAKNPDFKKRFLDEARLAATLTHPNVVQVLDVGEVNELPFLVMELVEGTDLLAVCQATALARRPLAIGATLFIGMEVARGLAYLHKAEHDGQLLHLVHRDISPQNILVDKNGEVKITDFGVAHFDGPLARDCKTEAGAIVGKLRYMSPEQLRLDTLDERTDIFALGVVLHEMLCARRLVEVARPSELLQTMERADFDLPSERNPSIPPEVDAIISKALARDPGHRYANAGEMQRALAHVLFTIAPYYSNEELMVDINAALSPSSRTTQNEAGDAIKVEVEVSSGGIAGESLPSLVVQARARRSASVEIPKRQSRWSLAAAMPLALAVVGFATLSSKTAPPLAISAPAPVPLAPVVVQKIDKPAPAPVAAAPLPVWAPAAEKITFTVPAPVAPKPAAPKVRLLDGRPAVLANGIDALGPADAGAARKAMQLLEQGKAAHEAGQDERAEKLLNAALSAYPGLVPAYRALGDVYAKTGELELAASSLRTYLAYAGGAPDQSTVRAQLQKIEAAQ